MPVGGGACEFARRAVVWIAVAAAVACVSGCASPGVPLPPTLNLPRVVSGDGLTAMRVGGEVRLRWTTPKETTDKLPVKGAITAEVCRGLAGAGLAGGGLANVGLGRGCVAVVRATVSAGETEVVDRLPDSLAAGPVRLLVYRVRLLNPAGRTAGLSPAVYAAAGEGMGEVRDFAGETSSAGVELRWTHQSAGVVELERTLLDPAPKGKDEQRGGLPGADRQSVDVLLRAAAGRADAGGVDAAGRADAGGTDAGGTDAGGTDAGGADAGGAVDRTVEIGHSYRYTAQRVEVKTLAGQTVELRGVESGPLMFVVRDVFPPPVPGGLVSVPGFAGVGTERPTIDLAWEPAMEQDLKPRLAGYRVYRQNRDGAGGGGWRLLTPTLVGVAAYRDADVAAGQRYAYRVTAVSTAGKESGPSGAAEETAPQGP
jgi:hypothetical protein